MPWESLSSRVIAGVAGFCALAAHAGAARIYVDANLASGNNNGTTWLNAFRGESALTAAIAAAAPGDEIWVADGRYTPGNIRSSTFMLQNDVAIYGGFAGGETQLDQRDPAVNIAVLSGDINNDDAPFPALTGWSENAFHVVFASNRNSSAVLDGFTITHGYANGPSLPDQNRGGGIFCSSGSPKLRNLVFTHNRAENAGGAIYLRTASPSITDCRIDSNLANNFGGAATVVTSANPQWLRCLISSNSSLRGGAIDVSGSSQPVFVNCVFTGNNSSGPSGGGAMYVGSSSVSYLFNCTLYANTSDIVGSAINTSGASTRLANCIVYANLGPGGDTPGQLFGSIYAVSYSCVQLGYPGFANISANPLLVDPAGGNFTPGPGSPTIDAGTNPGVPTGITLDLAHNPRFVDDPATADTGLGKPPMVDMGALEFQGGQSPCATDWDANGIVNSTDVGEFINDWFIDLANGTLITDFDANGVVNSTDVGEFINVWFEESTTGC